LIGSWRQEGRLACKNFCFKIPWNMVNVSGNDRKYCVCTKSFGVSIENVLDKKDRRLCLRGQPDWPEKWLLTLLVLPVIIVDAQYDATGDYSGHRFLSTTVDRNWLILHASELDHILHANGLTETMHCSKFQKITWQWNSWNSVRLTANYPELFQVRPQPPKVSIWEVIAGLLQDLLSLNQMHQNTDALLQLLLDHVQLLQ